MMNRCVESPKDVFFRAIQMDSPEEVRAFLDSSCGKNDELRNKVEELLAAHHQAGRFLGEYDTSVETEVDGSIVGQVVGPYELLEVIGEGGMGTIYLARQSHPVKRRVAIKLIKPGMDSRQVMARFETERQTLAMMDHPNIAKVLDAGTNEQGHPYFVMELVKGLPITEFCDQQKLPTSQRLILFRHVCQAIQHAHLKGIIHRDLKPSNIMVAMYDDQPVPKVIDFGVAKAIGEPLTEETFVTRFGQVVGTLPYMSPEQAQLNQLDIDTRSDIYSLGAVLYELLTGEPPFEKERLKSQALDETLRMIREEEPTKPSNRLRISPCAAQTAGCRATTTDKLRISLRGDLDWILMKALERDRTRRYATADELAAEMDRYLNHQPVNAGPPTAGYRFRKFAARNKSLVAFGITLTAILLLGTTGMTWMAIQSAQDKLHAERQSRIAAAVQQFWNEDVLSQADPLLRTLPVNSDVQLREIFDVAAQQIDQRFGKQPLVAAEICRVLSTGYNNLWENDRAVDLVNLEIRLREKELDPNDASIIDARSRLGFFLRQTDIVSAIATLERELAVCRQLLPPDDPVTIDTMRRLAVVYSLDKKLDQAAELMQEALALEINKFGETSKNVAFTLVRLGNIDSRRGDYDKAEQQFIRGLQIADETGESWNTCTLHVNWGYGLFLGQRERFSEALPHYQIAWDLARRMYGLKTPVAKDVGTGFAHCLSKLRKIDDEQLILKELIQVYPDDVELNVSLAGTLCNAGIIASVEGRNEDAIGNCRQAINLLDEILQRDPGNEKAQEFRVNSLFSLAMSLAETGDHDDANPSFQLAIDSIETNHGPHPEEVDKAFFLGLVYKYYGQSFEKMGQLEQAVEQYETCNQIWCDVADTAGRQRLGAADGRPSHPDGWMLLELLNWMIGAYMQLHRADDALRIMDQISDRIPESFQDPQKILLRELIRAYLMATDGKHREAAALVELHWPEGIAVDPSVQEWAVSTYAAVARALQRDSEIDDSARGQLLEEYGQRAVELLRGILSTDEYSSAEARQKLLDDDEYSVFRDRPDFKQLNKQP